MVATSGAEAKRGRGARARRAASLAFGLLNAAACAPAGPADRPAAPVADAAPWSMAEEIVAGIERPRIPRREFDVTDFGAVAGDGVDDRPAILAAIAAASEAGGGRVLLPPGEWLSAGPVVLKSRIDLHVGEGATLLFSPRAADYLPVVRTRWEGTLMTGYSPLIYAADVEDVAISGTGVIDGNAESEFHAWNSDEHVPRLPAAAMQRLRQMGQDGVPVEERVFGEGSYLRPSAIQFLGARRVLLEDYTIRNSPFWVNHLVFTQHAIVRRVKVDSHWGNNDGVDVDSSSHVLIEDNHFRTGDDGVVIKSGRDRDGREIGIPSEHVVVRRNVIEGEDGLALGSEMSGGIRFVFFEDNVLRSGASAMRFKASLDRGGVVEHVRVRNITIGEFENLIWFQLVRGDETDGTAPGIYRDIVFEDLRAGQVDRVLEVLAAPSAPLADVTLRNVAVAGAGSPLDLRNVEGLVFDAVTIGDQRVDGVLSWKAH
jgi:polygalacturonase